MVQKGDNTSCGQVVVCEGGGGRTHELPAAAVLAFMGGHASLPLKRAPVDTAYFCWAGVAVITMPSIDSIISNLDTGVTH